MRWCHQNPLDEPIRQLFARQNPREERVGATILVVGAALNGYDAATRNVGWSNEAPLQNQQQSGQDATPQVAKFQAPQEARSGG
jgi:hypothetical protein